MSRKSVAVSWAECGEGVERLVHGVNHSHACNAFTDVIGISKGGLLLMAAVCNSKEFKSVRMHVYEVAHHSGPGRSAEAVVRSAPNVFKGVTFAMRTMRILVVDDVIDSGKTINAVRDSVMLFRQDLTRPPVVQITYACLFLSARHSARADIIAHEMKPDDCWVKMPYEGIDG